MTKKNNIYSETLHFKNKEDYRKWLSYNYIHNPEYMEKGKNAKIYINGKLHKVKHKK